MKKFSLIIGVFILAVFAVSAFAAGNLPWNIGKPAVQVQNIKSIAPTAGKSRCETTATATQGNTVFHGYTSAGFLGVEAAVVDSANAGVNVTWSEDGTAVWAGSTYSLANSQGNVVSKVAWTYSNTSSASKSLKTCVRRQ